MILTGDGFELIINKIIVAYAVQQKPIKNPLIKKVRKSE